MNKVKGYIFSRPFFGERVPAHVQNIVLKDFCTNNDLKLLLSSTEFTNYNSSLVLFETLKYLKDTKGIIFYSIFQLPHEKKIRDKFYKIILKNKKIAIFAVEKFYLEKKKDILEVEKLWKLKLHSSKFMLNFENTKKKLLKYRF